MRDRRRRIAERRRARDDPVVRILDALQQGRANRQLVDSELVQVAVGNSDVRDVRSDVRELDRRTVRELSLNRYVPLLHGAGSQRAVNREHTLAKSGRGRGAGDTVSRARCQTV